LRRVERHADFDAALEASIRECASAFGSSRVLIEKYVAAPRHIEIQIFADRHGNVIHLGERDCSLQRRHQKVVEEAPAPGMTAELRAQMGAAAVEAARATGYSGAGTVEFVADGSAGLRAGAFWFIEMNTRLQVEHPVTEAVTGLDLVEWQFRVAAGERLPLSQEQVQLHGHAVEARVYAEDVENGFLPSPGRIVALQWPADIRIDSGVEAGTPITPFYDPMIAKLIAHAPTRDAALDRLGHALERTAIAGPRTNLAFLAALCRAPEFRSGRIDTGFIDRNLAALGAVPHEPDDAAVALAVARLLAQSFAAASDEASPDAGLNETDGPWGARDGFQLGGTRSVTIPVVVDGKRIAATANYRTDGVWVDVNAAPPAEDAQTFAANGDVYVLRNGRQTHVRLEDFAAGAATEAGDGVIRAPMHGRLLQIFVRLGDQVVAGQRLAIIEAMKMEHTLHAPFAGTVRSIAADPAAQLVEGGEIMVIERAETR
jgi:3-methylcrotonyl-CoA carboxylase alpha subunit